MPGTESEIQAAKTALRKAMQARRGAMPPAERASSSQILARHVATRLAPAAGSVVSGFLSIGDEIDTAPLLTVLHAGGCRLCLPVMQGRDRPLLFRAWCPGDALDSKLWGIREPAADKPELVPAILLVPLLAFDPAGWRLGYGGGYYDRTLRQARRTREILAVGLAFDAQQVDAVPHLDYDERLDRVLTPSGLIECQR